MNNTIPVTQGRIVLFTLGEEHSKRSAGEVRPAIVTRVWSNDNLQLNVQMDPANDGSPPVLPVTSVKYDPTGQVGTWRWMEYQKGQAAKTDSFDLLLKDVQAGVSKALLVQREEFNKRIDQLTEWVVALNQKQPANQRVTVADPALIVPEQDPSLGTVW